MATRYQLERIPFLDTDLADDIFEADVVVEEAEEEVVGTDLADEKPVGPVRLWSNRTEEDKTHLGSKSRVLQRTPRLYEICVVFFDNCILLYIHDR